MGASMRTLLSAVSLVLASGAYQPPAPATIEIDGLLDLAGLAIAIWTFWSAIGLRLGGQFLRAFQLISVGALAFALSHLLDSILQLLDVHMAILIHQGAVLIAMLFFVSGIASLADTLPTLGDKQQETSLRLWPLAVGLVIIIGALSFILYGIGPLAETWAFFGLDGSLTLLSAICLVLVIRAHLGGVIGRSLWQALLGLLLFSLAHPFQAWFYEETTYNVFQLAIMHRLVVIPAFLLFAFSITSVARHIRPLAAE